MKLIKRVRHLKMAMVGCVLASSVFSASSALATTVEITVTNVLSDGGLTLTPVYFGFHNGSVDLFDAGAPASAGIEEIAELGSFATLSGERLAMQGDSAGAFALGTDIGAPGPIEPGESASFMIDLDVVDNRFMFFAAMVVPSNDTFIGVDDPTQFALFDAMGAFLGPQVINITGDYIYDAGTEVNNAAPDGGAAFVVGRDATQGLVEGGVIGPGQSLADFIGLDLANGTTLGSDIDFVTDPSNFVIAQIEITAVPAPPALALLSAGFLGLGALARRRKQVA